MGRQNPKPGERSLSARRAWIEIFVRRKRNHSLIVALRKESVDRNLYYQDNKIRPAAVALRKESVDRNNDILRNFLDRRLSLSARRAWIEIFTRNTLA